MKVHANLIFLGALFVAVRAFHTREFRLDDVDDVEDDEPDRTELAAVARYVVHKSEWTSMATISTDKNITGFPFVNIISVADSAKGEASTGNIYFYLANVDFTTNDLLKDNRLSVLFSNDQDLACSNKGIDPMEPTCARIMISGSAVKLDVNSEEYKFGNRAFMSRHPAAQNWIKAHNFYLCKVDISQIIVLDWYGGGNYVEAKDYYNVKSETVNGFVKKTNQKKKEKGESLEVNKHEEKIRIKINRGGNSVYFEI